MPKLSTFTDPTFASLRTVRTVHIVSVTGAADYYCKRRIATEEGEESARLQILYLHSGPHFELAQLACAFHMHGPLIPSGPKGPVMYTGTCRLVIVIAY